MKTAGIIAEYNPFHNGHQFHIEETRRRTGADYIIAVMSGDFVQRGAPALLNKYTRAQMALRHGADLVLELPVTASLSSAEGFATGGISMLEHLGTVDVVSFGCENASAKDRALFQYVVKILCEEPEEYQILLASYLKKGFSFPKAREQAVINYLQTQYGNRPDPVFEPEVQKQIRGIRECSDAASASKSTRSSLQQLLFRPNNILALEYAKAIRKSGSSMEICMIPRQGDSYHAAELSGKYGSATAIRNLIFSNIKPNGKHTNQITGARVLTDTAAAERRSDTAAEHHSETAEAALHALNDYTPTDIADTLYLSAEENQCLCENDFSDLLFYALTDKKQEFSNFGSANSDLSDRTANCLEQFKNWTDFAGLLKSKNQTYTAINRYLSHILLNITREDLQLSASYGHAPYARILGFKRESAPLLTAIGKHADIPVLMQPAKDAKKLDEKRMHLLDLTVKSSEIYKRMLFSRSGCRLKSEYRQPLILI